MNECSTRGIGIVKAWPCVGAHRRGRASASSVLTARRRCRAARRQSRATNRRATSASISMLLRLVGSPAWLCTAQPGRRGCGPRYLSASYRDNSRKSQPSICGGLLAELSADKNTMRDPACVLCGHVAMVAGHQVAYLDRLNLPAMFSQQVTDVGALLVEP